MKRLLILIFLALLVSSCKSDFTDISNQVKSSNIPLPENKHAYSVIWVSNNTIIFVKSLNREDFDQDYFFDQNSIVINEELYSYDIDTQEWKEFTLDTNLDCHVQDIGWMERLPNNNLGLVQSCRNIRLDIIQEFDFTTHKTQALFQNNISPNMEIKWVGSYAFSPDMTELVQEYPIGRFLSNQLYYIKLGEKPMQIFPDFLRVMYPDWSPHDREIAFWGTENYKGNNKPKIKTTWDLVGLADYPWDLYMSSPEGENVRLMLSSIGNPGNIAWSPIKNIIAFSGEFGGIPGLWLFDPVTLEITRIWNKQVGFSWSPDGKKIITSYVKYADYPEIEEVSINIIDVP